MKLQDPTFDFKEDYLVQIQAESPLSIELTGCEIEAWVTRSGEEYFSWRSFLTAAFKAATRPGAVTDTYQSIPVRISNSVTAYIRCDFMRVTREEKQLYYRLKGIIVPLFMSAFESWGRLRAQIATKPMYTDIQLNPVLILDMPTPITLRVYDPEDGVVKSIEVNESTRMYDNSNVLDSEGVCVIDDLCGDSNLLKLMTMNRYISEEDVLEELGRERD